MIRNEKSFILITSFIVIIMLLSLGHAFLLTATAHSKRVERGRKSTQAFYLAEAGVDAAIYQIKNVTSTGTLDNIATSAGIYSSNWGLKSGTTDIWTISSTGTVDSISHKVYGEIQRMSDEVDVTNALYFAKDLSINGNAYQVTGDVIYGGTSDIQHDNVTGDITQDPSINTMFDINLTALRAIAEQQGNIYDATSIQTAEEPYFWHGDDEANGINVIYVEGDVNIEGPLSWTINGFLVVAGDVASGDNEGDVSLTGDGTINGVIYGKGGFKLSGNVTINGGVMMGGEGPNGASELSTISGSIAVNYDQAFMNEVNADLIQPFATFSMLEWKEVEI
jgi:hypothetical protein